MRDNPWIIHLAIKIHWCIPFLGWYWSPPVPASKSEFGAQIKSDDHFKDYPWLRERSFV